ncbi:hypothetical protein [Novosphingobium beihaiensis]|uniref:Uncharacterized protein n=1 Tax=Novosphingobium beihaiensis TaxID=2930389 RepID=A0ABT0BNJ4_9SPHN|nr:hypothetical protein [Novosphingobium beihaiensis]MCJ2186619.1 hypothetical protein [Novosphingobium beihaiensis]
MKSAYRPVSAGINCMQTALQHPVVNAPMDISLVKPAKGLKIDAVTA